MPKNFRTIGTDRIERARILLKSFTPGSVCSSLPSTTSSSSSLPWWKKYFSCFSRRRVSNSSTRTTSGGGSGGRKKYKRIKNRTKRYKRG